MIKRTFTTALVLMALSACQNASNKTSQKEDVETNTAQQQETVYVDIQELEFMTPEERDQKLGKDWKKNPAITRHIKADVGLELNMEKSRKLDLQYAKEYALNISTKSNKGKYGKVSLDSQWVNIGDVKTFTALEDPDALFDHWEGDIDGATVEGNQVTLTMDKPRNIVAVYKTKKVDLSIKSEFGDPKGAGTYNRDSSVDWSVTSPFAVNEGERLVTPDAKGVAILDKDRQVKLVWDREFLVKADSDPQGKVEGTSGWLRAGTPASFTASAVDDAYEFVSWEGVSAEQATANPLTIDVKGATALKALFAKKEYELIVESEHGTITGQGLHRRGTDVTWAVTSPTPGVDGVRYSAVEATGSVKLDKDQTVKVEWTKEYLVEIVEKNKSGEFVAFAEWVPAGTTLSDIGLPQHLPSWLHTKRSEVPKEEKFLWGGSISYASEMEAQEEEEEEESSSIKTKAPGQSWADAKVGKKPQATESWKSNVRTKTPGQKWSDAPANQKYVWGANNTPSWSSNITTKRPGEKWSNINKGIRTPASTNSWSSNVLTKAPGQSWSDVKGKRTTAPSWVTKRPNETWAQANARHAAEQSTAEKTNALANTTSTTGTSSTTANTTPGVIKTAAGTTAIAGADKNTQNTTASEPKMDTKAANKAVVNSERTKHVETNPAAAGAKSDDEMVTYIGKDNKIPSWLRSFRTWGNDNTWENGVWSHGQYFWYGDVERSQAEKDFLTITVDKPIRLIADFNPTPNYLDINTKEGEVIASEESLKYYKHQTAKNTIPRHTYVSNAERNVLQLDSLKEQISETDKMVFMHVEKPDVLTGAKADLDIIDYAGWTKCVRLSTEYIQVIIAPQVGRVVYMGSPDGENNVLWLNEGYKGEKFTRTEAEQEWHDVGGSRVWVAPQEINRVLLKREFPPAFEFDGSPVKNVITSAGKVTLQTPLSKETGCSIERVFELKQNRLYIKTSLMSSTEGDKHIYTLGPKTLTQFQRPEAITFGRSIYKDQHPDGYVVLNGTAPEVQLNDEGKHTFPFPEDLDTSWELGTHSSYLQLEFPTYNVTAVAMLEPGSEVCKKNTNIQIYSPEAPVEFVEVSHIGTMGKIEEGTKTTSEVIWIFEKK